MQHALKSLENNALAALTSRAPTGIVNAIKNASTKTGVSFSYLMEKAAAESNFNPTVKAKSSSATGLFQFIESTWMDMVNKHGAKYGIDTGQSRRDLLELRKDPQMASLMAAEFAEENQCYLEENIGGDIGNTELYFAHFMGAGGANAFLSQLKKNPLAIAPDLFPKEARANRNVFYDSKTGTPKTLQQVYDFFDKKFSGDKAVADAPIETLARKPQTTAAKEGYHITPISEERYTRVAHTNLRMRTTNSLHQMQRQIDDYFTSPVKTAMPSSLYGNLASPTAVFLNMLRE